MSHGAPSIPRRAPVYLESDADGFGVPGLNEQREARERPAGVLQRVGSFANKQGVENGHERLTMNDVVFVGGEEAGGGRVRMRVWERYKRVFPPSNRIRNRTVDTTNPIPPTHPIPSADLNRTRVARVGKVGSHLVDHVHPKLNPNVVRVSVHQHPQHARILIKGEGCCGGQTGG